MASGRRSPYHIPKRGITAVFSIEFRRGSSVIAKATTRAPTLKRAFEEARRRAADLGADRVLVRDAEGNEFGPLDVGGL